MRSPSPHRLSFLLPAGAAPERALMACAAPVGASLTLYAAGLAVFRGAHRAQLFDNASDFLLHACEGLGPLSIAASLWTPEGAPGGPGRDAWTVIIGANIAFCPSGLAPEIPRAGARAPPVLGEQGAA